MTHRHSDRAVTDEERREFLRVLGAGSAVAAGGTALSEVRSQVSETPREPLASIGQGIRSDVTGTLDANLLASGQSAVAERASELPVAVERGFPEDGARDEFAQVAAAGRPVYDHLTEVGFFESTTERLPEFTPEYLEKSVKTFVGSEALAEPLADMGLTEEEGTDLVATVVSNAERIDQYHWVATDEIPRASIEFGEHVPAMTRAAAGGVLLWLGDVDDHLWKHQTLLTEDILRDATWHARSMAAGFQLMTEAARRVAGESGELSDDELGALLSTGFAVQAISQNLLPEDVYWITEEMRAERRTDLETVSRR